MVPGVGGASLSTSATNKKGLPVGNPYLFGGVGGTAFAI